MSILPPVPEQPAHTGIVLFGPTPAQLSWIVNTIHHDLELIAAQLDTVIQKEAQIMATLADLNQQLDSITASESAEAASLATLGTALTTIITDLQNLPPVGVLTQADLDAVVQKATDDATAAAANAATGSSESAQATGAVPPVV